MKDIRGARLIIACVFIGLLFICNCAYLYFIDGLSVTCSIMRTGSEFANYFVVLAFALVIALIILFVWNKFSQKKINKQGKK